MAGIGLPISVGWASRTPTGVHTQPRALAQRWGGWLLDEVIQPALPRRDSQDGVL